jgi:hypothetical protein
MNRSSDKEITQFYLFGTDKKTEIIKWNLLFPFSSFLAMSAK